MKEFEKYADEIEQDRTYEYEVENCVEWIKGSDRVTATFSQGRWISVIEKLAEKFPDEVEICHRNYYPSGNVSSIVAHFPVSYLHISNRKRELTEDERKAIGERLKGGRTTQDV